MALMAHLLTTGACAGGNPVQTNREPALDMGQVFESWKPHQLYLQTAPHPKLYVEIGAVQGCEPSDATLVKLREFLAAYCAKPNGIEIVRDELISTQDARGLSNQALIRKYLKGPPRTETNPPPAFVYILFYDGLLSDQPAMTTNGAVAKLQHPPERDKHPNTQLSPYPYILINTSYQPKYEKALRDVMLLHEAGHLLGLATRAGGAKDYHCLNKRCLMTPNVHAHVITWHLGRYPLCDECKAELRAHAQKTPVGNLRFVGPVLVRSETGYHVLSLPRRVRLIVGDLTEQDCEAFLAKFQREARETGRQADAYVDFSVSEAKWKDKATLQENINRALNDPYNVVRMLAATMQKVNSEQP